MKALVVRAFGGPEVIAVETVPDPSPAAHQVLVRVKAIGVNPVDTYIRSGTYARKPALPYTPHTDIGGVVEAVGGETASRFAPGDRVYGYGVTGGAAELVVCEPAQLQTLPDRVTYAQGAALGVPYATAWRALLDRASGRAGETVLVHGASGGVGLAAVQIARAHGLRVAGTAGSPEGVALVREQGAHAAADHRAGGYLDELLQATAGRGFDVILEMLANVNLDRDLDLLAPHGRVVVVGNRGRIEIDPRKVMAKNGAILGMMLAGATPDELRGIHAGLLAGLENGTLNPVIGREFPLEEAAAAHIAVLEPGARGKIVLRV